MTQLHKTIKDADFSPRERAMLVITNDVHNYKTGEYLFEESEITNIAQGWKPGEGEARQYNKYMHFWRAFKRLHRNMAAQFMSAQLSCANLEKIVTFYYNQNNLNEFEDVLQQRTEGLSGVDPFDYILENTGLDYRAFLHTQTFISLPKKVQEDFLLIDEYAIDNYYYFNQEEKLASVLLGKDELSQDEVEMLAEVINESLSWDREEVHNSRPFFVQMVLSGYFGSLPLVCIAEELAEEHKIRYTDSTDMYRQISDLSCLKDKVQSVLEQMIGAGIFDEYPPLCNSIEKETYLGETKLSHRELWKIWSKTKEQARSEIQEKIDGGQYVIKERNISYSKVRLDHKIIVGTGIYYGDDNLQHVREFRDQVEKLRIYGYLFKEIIASDVEDQYSYLLKYSEILQRVSSVIDQDIRELAERMIKDNKSAIETTNIFIQGVATKTDRIHEEARYTFPLSSLLHSFVIQTEEVEPQHFEVTQDFEEEALENLVSEWKLTNESFS